MWKNKALTRQMLKECDQETFDRILHRAKFTPEEQELCFLRYCKGKQLYQIAMEWKCSESRVYQMHSQILSRLENMQKQ